MVMAPVLWQQVIEHVIDGYSSQEAIVGIDYR
jgi:hypothetical protein